MTFLDKYDDRKKKFEEFDNLIATMKKELDEIQTDYKTRISTVMNQSMSSQFVPDELPNFIKKPYVIIPAKRPDEWYVAVPKMINFFVGWLDYSDESYNVFKVNKFVNWLGEIPTELQSKFKFKPKLPLQIYNGTLLTGVDHQEEAWARYNKFLTRREGKDKIKVKRGREFDLIVTMLNDGILPFSPKPVEAEDLRTPSDYPDWMKELLAREYVKRAKDKFMEYGATGIYWAFSAGKSIFGTHICDILKGRKLVVVPTRTLVEQWKERLRKHTQAYYETDVVTYHSYHKVRNKEYMCVMFDEVHHLPANTFSRFATIRAKYRLGYSGSVYREDGRSVRGEEPILIKSNGEVKMTTVGEVIDCLYNDSNSETPISASNLEVYALTQDFKIKWMPVSYVSRHKIDEIVELKLETGRSIGLTKSHSIMALGSDLDIIPKRVADLKVNDMVVIPKRLQESQGKNISKEMSRLLGLYIADGSMVNRTPPKSCYAITFSLNKNNEFIPQVVSDIKKEFGIEPHKYLNNNEMKVSITRKKVVDAFCKFGLYGLKAKTKRIPTQLFNSSPEIQKEFLDYYIKGDAGVSVNRKLISDCMYLALQRGILTSLHNSFSHKTAIFEDGHKVKGRQRYMLHFNKNSPYGMPFDSLRGFYSILLPLKKDYARVKFADRVNSKNHHKFFRERLNRQIEILERAEKGISTQDLQKAYSKTISNWGYFLRKFERKGLIKNPNKRSAKWFLTDKGRTLIEKHKKVMKLIFDSDIEFVKIKEMKTKQYDGFVYDFSVPNSETFVCGTGGVLCHNTDYIFALTGYPIGLNWDNLIKLGIIEQPDIRVYIFTSGGNKAKIKKLAELLKIPKKTIIFCDEIALGKRLSKEFDVPFVYGQSTKRLETIRQSEVTVVSRVGDEGVSLPDIQRVIEVSFLFGSRRQEAQRMGRLFHGEEKGQHIVLMTEEEFEKYNKRLLAIHDKGFKVEYVRV